MSRAQCERTTCARTVLAELRTMRELAGALAASTRASLAARIRSTRIAPVEAFARAHPRIIWSLSLLIVTTTAQSHVPPDPPQHEVGEMSYREMVDMMEMDDASRFGEVLLDQAEWREADGEGEFVWDGEASFGGDINKLVLRTEGEHAGGETREARADLLWDRVISRWWSLQAGVREDFGRGPSRNWVAFGVDGTSSLWFDVEATLYAADEGRTAARIKIEHDVLLTQRWILQPELEANLYGKSDPERLIGSGLSDIDLGLRLRYEIRREVAPYVGVAWKRSFGPTEDLLRDAGESESNLQLVAGIRIWF